MKIEIRVNSSSRQDFKAIKDYIRLQMAASDIAMELYQWAKKQRRNPMDCVLLLRQSAMLLEDKYKTRAVSTQKGAPSLGRLRL